MHRFPNEVPDGTSPRRVRGASCGGQVAGSVLRMASGLQQVPAADTNAYANFSLSLEEPHSFNT